MKSFRQRPTVLKENSMKRPDLDILACVNPACQRFRHAGQSNLSIRKIYGHDHMRLLRVSGRHAERFHDQHVRALRPMALEFDEQWSFVKKSKNAAPIMNWVKLVTGGIIPPWPLTASWWCP